LKLVLLDVGPKLLDALASSCLWLANNVGQILRQLVRLGQAGSLRHGELRFKRSATTTTRYVGICAKWQLKESVCIFEEYYYA
jgi:hypothetical protein